MVKGKKTRKRKEQHIKRIARNQGRSKDKHSYIVRKNLKMGIN